MTRQKIKMKKLVIYHRISVSDAINYARFMRRISEEGRAEGGESLHRIRHMTLMETQQYLSKYSNTRIM